jgi:hypothetical protein
VDPEVLTATNPGMLPVPLAAIPIAVFEFVHVNVPPPGILLKFAVGIVLPLQTAISAGTFTVGVGFTVIVKLVEVPMHPRVGVTVMVAVFGELDVLIAVKLAMFPVPLDASPIVEFVFVQVKVAPPGTLTKLMAGITSPLQTEMFEMAVVVGDGIMVMVSVADTAGHPPAAGILFVIT